MAIKREEFFLLNTSSSISSEFTLTDRPPKLLQFGEKEIIGKKI